MGIMYDFFQALKPSSVCNVAKTTFRCLFVRKQEEQQTATIFLLEKKCFAHIQGFQCTVKPWAGLCWGGV